MAKTTSRAVEITLLSISLFCLLGALLILSGTLAERPIWKPFEQPISLKTGTVTTNIFKTNWTGTYDIALEFRKAFASDAKLQCLLGVPPPESQACEGADNLIEIHWKLTEGNAVIAEGASNTSPALIESDAIDRIVGRVECTKGHQYRLVLEVTRDGSQLDSHSPKIVVQVPNGVMKDYGAGIAIDRSGAGILAAIGLFFACGFLYYRKSRTLALRPKL